VSSLFKALQNISAYFRLKYPKGAARVTFSTSQAFVAAIAGRFVKIPQGDVNKRVS